MYVDDKTMSVLGQRSDGSTRDELILRAYASPLPTSFTLYEDDGQTQAYLGGAYRTTDLSQQLAADGRTAAVTVAAASGSYNGAPASRATVVELVTDGVQASSVSLNGNPLPEMASPAAVEAAPSGWVNAGGNLIMAKSEVLPAATEKAFVFSLETAPADVTASFQCRNATTVWGQSVYVVGNVAALGAWNPALALKLAPNGPYPTWTNGKVKLPPATTVEWRCIKRAEFAGTSHVDLWQPGANNVLQTSNAGDAGTSVGDFAAGGPVGALTAHFTCDNGTTVRGQSVYVVGAVDRLGNWDPARAVKLDPTSYPRWTGTVDNLPASSQIEWKCLKRPEGAPQPVVWQEGSNNLLTTPAAGTVATAGSFQP